MLMNKTCMHGIACAPDSLCLDWELLSLICVQLIQLCCGIKMMAGMIEILESGGDMKNKFRWNMQGRDFEETFRSQLLLLVDD